MRKGIRNYSPLLPSSRHPISRLGSTTTILREFFRLALPPPPRPASLPPPSPKRRELTSSPLVPPGTSSSKKLGDKMSGVKRFGERARLSLTLRRFFRRGRVVGAEDDLPDGPLRQRAHRVERREEEREGGDGVPDLGLHRASRSCSDWMRRRFHARAEILL